MYANSLLVINYERNGNFNVVILDTVRFNFTLIYVCITFQTINFFGTHVCKLVINFPGAVVLFTI